MTNEILIYLPMFLERIVLFVILIELRILKSQALFVVAGSVRFRWPVNLQCASARPGWLLEIGVSRIRRTWSGFDGCLGQEFLISLYFWMEALCTYSDVCSTQNSFFPGSGHIGRTGSASLYRRGFRMKESRKRVLEERVSVLLSWPSTR